MVVDMKGHRQEFENEEGYVLLAVIFLTVILLISLAIAAPKVAKSIQRDKDLETIHRGEQYKRAIKLYYQKFGSYPTSIDQLVETNQMRFLRKKYTDPETGKDDWKPVLFGQAHVRPLGFFGQPLMMAGAVAGAGSMYAVTTTTTTDANGVPIASGDTSGTDASGGSSAGTGTGLGSTSPSQGSQNGISSMFPQTSTTPGMGSPTGSPTGMSGTGTSATTFGGGGPIVGFTLPVDKASLVDYKLQTRYNKWEFNYDPTEEQAQALAGLSGGGPNGTNPTGIAPGAPGTTTSPGSLPTNPNPGTPAAPTDPTAPQR
jgi:type II secretory pathway pseudopilin PulG